MARFDEYFQMEADDIKEYTILKTKEFFDWDEDSMEVIIPAEHGNLNYVYRVADKKGNSVFIKQAGTETRISKDMKPSKDRNRLESEILILEDKFAPGTVPKIYFYDTVMCACGMEDCSDYQVMRTALLKGETFESFASDISDFMVNTLMLSSDLVLDHKEKKELVAKFISPDLCDITEKLVLMEPYNNLYKRNNVSENNKEFVEKELYGDPLLHLEVAKLKFKFMTKAEALLHGDLHTGSIFVKKGATKVFDSEFGTYAPMGYDIGNIIANLVFAYDNGLHRKDEDFCSRIILSIEQIVDLFIEKFNDKYDSCVTEPMAKVTGFKEWYLDEVLKDTAGFAGTELHRRTVGMANVADVKGIEDEKDRLLAERLNIFLGKEYILNSDKFKTGKDFVAAIFRAKDKAISTL